MSQRKAFTPFGGASSSTNDSDKLSSEATSKGSVETTSNATKTTGSDENVSNTALSNHSDSKSELDSTSKTSKPLNISGLRKKKQSGLRLSTNIPQRNSEPSVINVDVISTTVESSSSTLDASFVSSPTLLPKDVNHGFVSARQSFFPKARSNIASSFSVPNLDSQNDLSTSSSKPKPPPFTTPNQPHISKRKDVAVMSPPSGPRDVASYVAEDVQESSYDGGRDRSSGRHPLDRTSITQETLPEEDELREGSIGTGRYSSDEMQDSEYDTYAEAPGEMSYNSSERRRSRSRATEEIEEEGTRELKRMRFDEHQIQKGNLDHRIPRQLSAHEVYLSRSTQQYVTQPPNPRHPPQSFGPPKVTQNRHYEAEHNEQAEQLRQKWSRCTFQEWEEGGKELMVKFQKLTDFVQDHMKAKMQFYATLQGRVGQHSTILNSRDELLKDVRQQLVSKAGFVVGGAGMKAGK